MPQPAKPSLGRKVLKIAGIVLGCIVGLILLASILLLTVLEPVVARILKEQVTENTDGLYTLDFEDLQLNLLTGTLTLQQLHIHPDTTVHREQRKTGAANRMLFKMEAPHFRISRINLLDALFRNQISIGTVAAERPVITLIADESIEKDKAEDKEDGDMLSGFLDDLQIGKIDIQDATFRYLTLGEPNIPKHEIPQVSLLLRDFSIPPRGQETPSQLFHADDVQLSVRNYAYQAPDSVYKLHVGLFTYSSKQAALVAEGVELLADHQANAALPPEKANPMLYNIKVPALRITDLDLLEAYTTKQLLIREILLENPEFNVLMNASAAAITTLPDIAELYQNISDYLTAVEIRELRLAGGTIKVTERLDKLYTVHELEGTEVALQEIRLDSGTLFSPRKNLPAEALLFSAESYIYAHPFSPHTIKTGNMELSTRGNYLQVGAIQVTGDKGKNDRLKQSGRAKPLVFNVNASGLRLQDMNLLQALQTKHLTIDQIDLLNPSIKLLRDKDVKKADIIVMLQEAYTSVSDVISSLVVDSINVQDASLTHLAGARHLTLVQELKHISLKAIGLKIDSAFIFSPAAEGLPVEEAVLTAHNYTFRTPDRLYTLTLDRIHYSTRTELLAARAVALSYDQAVHNKLKERNAANQNLYSISASHFQVTGLDLIKAVETGELLLDQVVLRQPDFAMLKDRAIQTPPQQESGGTLESVYSIVNPIRVNRLRMEDGTFTYREKRGDVIRMQQLDHASASVLGLNLGAARLDALDDVLPMQEMKLTAAGYTYRSPDGIYTLTLDSLLYSSRAQELTARRIDVVSDKEANARLKRNNSEHANRYLFDVSANKFRVTGLDLIKAYETGKFAMEEMLLTAPEVAILQDRNVPSRSQDASDREENVNDSETLEQLTEVVETFRVEQLRINEGNFQFNILQDTVLTSQRIAHVSVAIDELRTTSLDSGDPLEIFQVDEVGVLVRHYTYLLPDSLYRLKVGEIRSSLQEQSLYVEDLHLQPLYDRDEFMSRLQYEDDRFDVHVPQLQLQGVNLNALVDNQDFIMEKMLLLNPVLKVYRDKRIPEDPDRRPPTLQEMLRDVEYAIQVDTVSLEGGVLTYGEVAPDGVEPGTLILDETKIEILNVTNIPDKLEQDSTATVQASALLMGESKLSVSFVFHMNHPEDLYTYEGSLEPMDFTALNPLFMNLIFIRIEDGQINRAAFSVRSTKHYAEGNMNFFYNDFEIQLIDKEDPDNPGFLRNAASWVLNNLVLKSNNPAGRRDLREGSIEVERDYSKSVFNHMSKAMIDGITSSLTTPFIERILDRFVEL